MQSQTVKGTRLCFYYSFRDFFGDLCRILTVGFFIYGISLWVCVIKAFLSTPNKLLSFS